MALPALGAGPLPDKPALALYCLSFSIAAANKLSRTARVHTHTELICLYTLGNWTAPVSRSHSNSCAVNQLELDITRLTSKRARLMKTRVRAGFLGDASAPGLASSSIQARRKEFSSHVIQLCLRGAYANAHEQERSVIRQRGAITCGETMQTPRVRAPRDNLVSDGAIFVSATFRLLRQARRSASPGATVQSHESIGLLIGPTRWICCTLTFAFNTSPALVHVARYAEEETGPPGSRMRR